jgi:hypothetical protein
MYYLIIMLLDISAKKSKVQLCNNVVKFDKDFNQLKVAVEVTLLTFVHENGEVNDRVVDKTEESDEISPLNGWFKLILILFC